MASESKEKFDNHVDQDQDQAQDQAQDRRGTIDRYDRPSRVSDSERLSHCDGCKELAERVERLEQLLADRGLDVTPHNLSTTECYWICIGMHAMGVCILCAAEPLVQFGMMMSLGAIATLVVTQVFSTRPIHQRILRTLLSVSLVVGAAMMGLWMGDVAAPSDVFPYALMLFPPVFASGWIVAKLLVWTRGWRIVPPGYSTSYPKLGILHLMLCTMMCAVYLAANRMMVDDLESWFGEDFITTIIYLCVPAAACTAISCCLARILLERSSASAWLRCLALAVASVACMSVLVLGLFATAGVFTVSGEIVLALMLYVLPLIGGVFVSSGSTFALMRIANYRFARNET